MLSHDYLACGHPRECSSDDIDKGDVFCVWCRDEEILRGQIATLKTVLHQKAVVVNGGSPSFMEPIGLLEITGGTVTIATMIAKRVTDSGAAE